MEFWVNGRINLHIVNRVKVLSFADAGYWKYDVILSIRLCDDECRAKFK